MAMSKSNVMGNAGTGVAATAGAGVTLTLGAEDSPPPALLVAVTVSV